MFPDSGWSNSYFTPCYWPPGAYQFRRSGYSSSQAFRTPVLEDIPAGNRVPFTHSLMEAIEQTKRILALDHDEEEAIILLATALILDDD